MRFGKAAAGVVAHAAHEALGRGIQHGQRPAELVRNQRDEIAIGLCRPLRLVQIVDRLLQRGPLLGVDAQLPALVRQRSQQLPHQYAPGHQNCGERGKRNADQPHEILELLAALFPLPHHGVVASLGQNIDQRDKIFMGVGGARQLGEGHRIGLAKKLDSRHHHVMDSEVHQQPSLRAVVEQGQTAEEHVLLLDERVARHQPLPELLIHPRQLLALVLRLRECPQHVLASAMADLPVDHGQLPCDRHTECKKQRDDAEQQRPASAHACAGGLGELRLLLDQHGGTLTPCPA
ncbi:hypothetical protein SDC9_88622 [bioreactor metagenome]|uniref:Uncharacterized protein n=1 Tax=bioreactor metagenome TaxID=1076179 RepID=A0A644ZM09_9ZZZZ